MKIQPDEMMEVWHSEETGVFEWICGHTIAAELLNGGMTHINGKPVRLEVIDEYHHLEAVQIRATMSDRPQRGPL